MLKLIIVLQIFLIATISVFGQNRSFVSVGNKGDTAFIKYNYINDTAYFDIKIDSKKFVSVHYNFQIIKKNSKTFVFNDLITPGQIESKSEPYFKTKTKNIKVIYPRLVLWRYAFIDKGIYYCKHIKYYKFQKNFYGGRLLLSYNPQSGPIKLYANDGDGSTHILDENFNLITLNNDRNINQK